MLAELRKTLAALERPPGMEDGPPPLPLGVAAIDAALGGGLARGALHEIAAASEPHLAAATGFALGALQGNERKPAAWIAQDMALIESGAPCGPGLDAFGLLPERLITVAAPRLRDLLWAMEEALRCQALGVVIGEIRREEIDAVALRRLSLAAAAGGGLALLLRSAPADDASTAATRWIAGAAPSRARYGPGTCIGVELVRNRRGVTGSWMLEWSQSDARFILASTHPVPVAAAPFDRPARARRAAVA